MIWPKVFDAAQSPAVSKPSTSAALPDSGQTDEAPLQVSAPWLPLATAQVVPAAASRSTGQVADEPEHVSATSQAPSAGRQTVPATASASAGQVLAVPEQVSGASHAPADARQTVPAAAKPLAGHAADVPEHVSATSHTPLAARHVVPAVRKPSAGQVRAVPLHVSATSQTPADARQVVPLATGEQVPTLPLRLQAPQPELQAVSQHTPFVQNPVVHWLFDVHASAKDAS